MEKKMLIVFMLAALFIGCQDQTNNSTNSTLDKDKIQSEILEAETTLTSALKNGDLMKGVSMHLNSPDYRNIWNGEIKTFETLEARIKMGMDNGLQRIDYQAIGRDFNIINVDNVLETLTATETTTMANGSSTTSGITAISILWQRIDNKWRLGYLHASEIPKQSSSEI